MIEHAADLARTDAHEAVLEAIEAGIDAVHPATVIPASVTVDGETITVGDERLQVPDDGRLLVVGAGKPAGAAAVALEAVLGDHIDGGVVVTDEPVDCNFIDVHVGSHPLPSAANVEATDRVLALADSATADDLVIAIIGGGGSALLCAPVEGITLDAYRAVTDALLEAGATIDELNSVRKHCSAVKGGRLAGRLAPARVAALVLSDVVGDPLDVIASGPLAPDPTTYADALAVLDRYDVAAPAAVVDHLERGNEGTLPETPAARDAGFDRVTHHRIATNREALAAAAACLEEQEYPSMVLSSRIEGEARHVGTALAGIALATTHDGDPAEAPLAILSGGETTVAVDGDGVGGPNQEFVLAAAMAIEGTDIIAAAVDTDGVDGPTDAAGALADGSTVTEPRKAAAALAENDAHAYLDATGATIETGPTGTNVNDLRILLVPDG